VFVEHGATRADFDAHVAGLSARKWCDALRHMIAVAVTVHEHKSI
jgi:hypothetical protein